MFSDIRVNNGIVKPGGYFPTFPKWLVQVKFTMYFTFNAIICAISEELKKFRQHMA